MVGLDRPDRGEHLPRDPVLASGVAVEREVVGGDAVLGLRARVALGVGGAARVRLDDHRQDRHERRNHEEQGGGGDRADAQRRGGRARGGVHRLAYASPIRVTSQPAPRRSRYSSSRYGGPPAAWRVAIARTLSGACSVTSPARMIAGRSCWVGVGRARWRRRSRRSSGAAALSVRVLWRPRTNRR